MNTKNDRRRELVAWSPDAGDLVFRSTTAKLSDFWAALCGPAGMKGFLDRHPEVAARAARDVLRLAGERFCWWPEDDAEQETARNRPDPRLEVAESTPRVRGGELCFIGTRLTFDVLFDNLPWDEDGQATLDDLAQWYGHFPKDDAARAVVIAADLFSEGLVPDAGLPGQRGSVRGGRASEDEGV